MRLNLCIVILSCVASVGAQESHQFLDRQNVIGFSLMTAARTADVAQTCSQPGREMFTPAQSCAGIAAWQAAFNSGLIGMSYVFHRTGHHKLERWVPYVSVGSSTFGIAYSYWPRKHHKCSSNWPCN